MFDITPDERDLVTLERVIQSGLTTFIEVGSALLEIRDRRLYRESHATFEAYCRERWGFSRAHAYRLVEAAEALQGMSPMGDTPLPTNERQARELARIPDPTERARIWREVTEEHGASVTAADIRRAASPDPPLLAIVDLNTSEVIDPEDEEEETWNERPAPLSRTPERFEVRRQTPQDMARVAATNACVVLERTRAEIDRALSTLEEISYGQLDARTQAEWQRCAKLVRGISEAIEHRVV